MADEETIDLIDRVIFETDAGTSRVRGWDAQFIQDLEKKREEYGEDVFISPKMLIQLKRIARNLKMSIRPVG